MEKKTKVQSSTKIVQRVVLPGDIVFSRGQVDKFLWDHIGIDFYTPVKESSKSDNNWR